MRSKTIAALAGAAILAAGNALAAHATRTAGPPPPATHEVRMILENGSARFEPASLTIRAGDRVRFVNVSSGPHNVSFDPARLPADVARVLAGAMPGQIQPLWGALVSEPGAAYTISFAGVRPGRYEFFCMPHQTMGMKGTVTVR